MSFKYGWFPRQRWVLESQKPIRSQEIHHGLKILYYTVLLNLIMENYFSKPFFHSIPFPRTSHRYREVTRKRLSENVLEEYSYIESSCDRFTLHLWLLVMNVIKKLYQRCNRLNPFFVASRMMLIIINDCGNCIFRSGASLFKWLTS